MHTAQGLLVYPNTILHFDVGREKSIKALESAMSKDKLLFVTAQKDESILIPTEKDFYETGTVVKIKTDAQDTGRYGKGAGRRPVQGSHHRSDD